MAAQNGQRRPELVAHVGEELRTICVDLAQPDDGFFELFAPSAELAGPFGDLPLKLELRLLQAVPLLADLRRHDVEAFGEPAELVVPPDGDDMREIAPADRLRAGRQRGDRARNRMVHHKSVREQEEARHAHEAVGEQPHPVGKNIRPLDGLHDLLALVLGRDVDERAENAVEAVFYFILIDLLGRLPSPFGQQRRDARPDSVEFADQDPHVLDADEFHPFAGDLARVRKLVEFLRHEFLLAIERREKALPRLLDLGLVVVEDEKLGHLFGVVV